MSDLSSIILRSGLINENTLREFRRWGFPAGEMPPKEEFAAEPSPETLARAIADAIEDADFVLIRETDLEAVPRFLDGMCTAVLHVVLEESGHDIEVQASRNGKQWIIPWRSESITDVLTNGETYLRVDGKRFYFCDAHDLFYGKHKAFVACTISTEEPDEDR